MSVVDGRLSKGSWGGIIYQRVGVLRTEGMIICVHQWIWGYDQFYSWLKLTFETQWGKLML